MPCGVPRLWSWPFTTVNAPPFPPTTSPELLIAIAYESAPRSVVPDALQTVPCAVPLTYVVPTTVPESLIPYAYESVAGADRAFKPFGVETNACWSPEGFCAHPATVPELLMA